MRKCAHCGAELPYRFHRRFCSDVCRQRAYRRRRQGLPESTPKTNAGRRGYVRLDGRTRLLSPLEAEARLSRQSVTVDRP